MTQFKVTLQKAKDHVLKEYDRIGPNDIRWYSPEFWFRHFKIDSKPEETFKTNAGKIRFYPEVASTIEKLSHKYPLIISSGIPTKYIEIAIQRFTHYFSGLFSPISDIQTTKKNEIFYIHVCRSLSIKPSSLVHIGDDYEYDYVSPRKIGAKSIFLDRNGEKPGKHVIRDLTELDEPLGAKLSLL